MSEIEKTENVKYKSIKEAKKVAVNILSDEYSSNNITLEVFENAITIIENANSIEEIRTIYTELKFDESELISRSFENINGLEKISSHGSIKKIASSSLITKKIEIDITHSKVILDYSNIQLPEGEYEIYFNAIHSVCLILLPNSINIDNRISEIYSKIKDYRKGIKEYNKTIIRLTGNLTHSEIKIKRIKNKEI